MLQEDGKIVVVGYRRDSGGPDPRVAPVLARFRPGGKLDHSFSDDGIVAPRLAAEGRRLAFGGQLHDVAIGRAGRIIAVGAQNEVNKHASPPSGMVIAYRPDGGVDRSFGHRGRVLFPVRAGAFEYTALLAVKVLPDSKILVSGYRRGLLFLARLTQDGRLDRSFGGGDGKVALDVNQASTRICCQYIASLLVEPDGQILVAGEGFAPSQAGKVIIARFSSDGRLDKSFGQGGIAFPRTLRRPTSAYDAALQGDGRIVIAGVGARDDGDSPGDPVFESLRALGDGRIDRGFGDRGGQPLAIGPISAAFVALSQPNGRVVVGGSSVVSHRLSPHQFSYETTLLLTRFRSHP